MPIEIASPEFVGDSAAFWLRRLRQSACPSCRVVGTLVPSEYPHGLIVYCARYYCSYRMEHAYHAKSRPLVD